MGHLFRRLLPGVADLRNYSPGWLRPDLLAGLAVWAVLVPQGLAYGELAGLSPVVGLYTALGALVLYALVGSSRYLHVGPESSVAIVTAAYVGGLVSGAPDRAAALASLLALVTAGFLIAGAALRLGVIARLLSTPVLAGYLTGSAVVIAASQLGKLLGIPTTGEQWWRKVAEVATHLSDTNPHALVVGAGSVVIVVVLLRWAPRVPAILVAIAAATALVGLAGWQDELPVIGHVPAGIPVPSLPSVRSGDLLNLLGAQGVGKVANQGYDLRGCCWRDDAVGRPMCSCCWQKDRRDALTWRSGERSPCRQGATRAAQRLDRGLCSPSPQIRPTKRTLPTPWLGAGASVALLVSAGSMPPPPARARRARGGVPASREFLGLAAASM